MEEPTSSVSVNQADIISLSDDSDSSPANHHADLDDRDEMETYEDQKDRGVETAKDEVVGSEIRPGDGNDKDQNQHEVELDGCGEDGNEDETMSGKDHAQQVVESKPSKVSLSVNVPVSHKVLGVVELIPNTSKPHDYAVVTPQVVSVIPPVTYYQRGMSTHGRKVRLSGTNPLRAEDPRLDMPARGVGRGRGRRRCRGPRFVTPLSLRQFYDNGGRDYVDYLMRHIQAGGSRRRRQQESSISIAPQLDEALYTTNSALSIPPPQSMPSLALIAFPPDVINHSSLMPCTHPAVFSSSSVSVVQANHSPLTSAHVHAKPPLDQHLHVQNKYSSATTGSRSEQVTSVEYGAAIDLSARTQDKPRLLTGSQLQQAGMTSFATTTLSPMPVMAGNWQHDTQLHDVRSWSRDDVVKFVAMVPGCSEYAETFHREKIDGISLLHLTDWHMLNVLNMRLGPALRLRIAIDAVRLGGPTPPTTNPSANWQS